jgi:YidC/Oxa1 family membrane protein insertase
MVEAKPKIAFSRRSLVITLLILVLIVLLIARVVSITGIFNTILLNPMLNFLILMSRFLGSFGLAIIVMTILIRLLLFPLSIRQLRGNKTFRDIQPKIKELQKRFAEDKQRFNEEIAKLYREAGVSPVGCFFSTISQFPFWIALYLSVVMILAYTPENLFGLSNRIYSQSILQNSLPFSHHFLGLDLINGNIVMAFLVGITLWMLQRMSYIPTPDLQQQSMNRLMFLGMPLVFAILGFILPSGVVLYWVTSNIVGMVVQYQVTGWGSLKRPSLASLRSISLKPARNPQANRRVTTRKIKKAGQGVTLKQVGAKTGSTTSVKKAAGGKDVGSSVKKIDHKKPDDERKG